MMKYLLKPILIILIIMTGITLAVVPDSINFQGKLTDPDGVAIEGTYSVTFNIYDAAGGGTLLWSETHGSVAIDHGLFDVILGSVSSLLLDFSAQYWVEISIAGETLTPRLPLTSTPYAQRAAIADSVVGGSGVIQNDVDVPLTLTGDFTVISGETEVHGALDDLDAAVAINQTDIADNAADIAAHDAADGDLSSSNELITDFTWDDGADQLTITEAGSPHSVTIDNEADDLSDNVINDLGNVNASPSSGQILGWNGSQWIAVDDATGSTTDDQNLSFTGSASPYTLDIEDGTDVTFASGTGITLSRSVNQLTITNSAPDQTVSIGSGTGISVTGSYPNFTVTNTAPWTGSSNDYIQNQNSADQSADYRISGNGIVGGRIGIGTTAPFRKLHLYGTSNNAADILSETDAGRVIKHWFNNAGRSWSIGQLGTTVAPNYQFRITDETAGVSRITINTDGTVGIGTNSPGYLLHVNGSARVNSLNINGAYNMPTTDGTANYVLKTNGSGTVSWAVDATGSGDSDWTISGTDQYSAVSGNVGIGTTSPGRKLDVVGDTELNGDLYFPVGLSTIDFPVENMRISPNWGMANGISIGNTSWNASVAILDNSVWSGDAMRLWGHLDMDENEIYAIDYLNFDDTKGSTGYGIRDNAGTVEYKNSGGSWAPITGGGGVGGSGSTNRLAIWSDASNLTYHTDLEWNETNNRLYFGSVEYLQDQGANEIGFYGDIEPSTDASYNLGNSDMAWNHLYIDGAIYLNGSAGSSGQVLTSNGTGDPTWSTPSGGSGLWQDDSDYIRPIEYDGFRVYDNESGWVGLWFTSSSGVNTLAAANLYHANGEHAYLAYDNMCGVQGDSDTENGVQGISSTTVADYAGVYGENSNSGSNVYGVCGYSQGYAGVMGSGPDYGLWGKSYGATSPIYGGWLYGTTYGIECSGDLAFWASSDRIYIGGDEGTAGEVLTSNGTSGIYWGTAGGGSSQWTDGGTYKYVNGNTNARAYEADQQYGLYGAASTGGSNASGVYGYMSSGDQGTGYGTYYSRKAVGGYAYYGYAYTYGVSGVRFDDGYDRGGGVFGGSSSENPPTAWGSLGYRHSSSTHYGAYWTSSGSGSGRRRPTPDSDDMDVHINIGAGGWGDLFGMDVHGEIYGAYIEGGRYALYTHGNNFTDGLYTQLISQPDDDPVVAYTTVSTDVSVMTTGQAQLSSGTANIRYDEDFSRIISSESPVIVNITPVIGCNPLYIASSDENGFTVVESDGGHSDGRFNWIAIGTRKGYEGGANLPSEVIAGDYSRKIARGLHNDSDMQTDGEGLYFTNGELYVGRHESTQPAPEVVALKREFSERPESRTYEQWEKAFKAIGEPEMPVSKQAFNEMTNSPEKTMALYDAYGVQISPEWVDTLTTVGYPMFTREEVMERRLEGYLSDALEIKEGRDNARPVRYDVEILDNGIHKYSDKMTGEVTYKNREGQNVTADGEIITGDGQPQKPRIYQLHPEADPTNEDNLNNGKRQ